MEIIRVLSSQRVFLASLTLLSYCNMIITYNLKPVRVVTFVISIFTKELFWEHFIWIVCL